MQVARRVRVTGRVQGVWYRGWTEGEARRLGLRGWVRNDPDGSVAAVLAGAEEAVAAKVEAMLRGQQEARVTGVESAPVEDEGWTGFAVGRR